MRPSRQAFLLAALLAGAGACGRLTAQQAASLIEAHPAFQEQTRHILVVDGNATKRCGIEEGLWVVEASGMKGAFRRATPEGQDMGIEKFGRNMTYLHRPVARLTPITVTAVGEPPEGPSETRKVVEFEYDHDVPEALSSCTGRARGTAVLVRGDAGWTVVELFGKPVS